MTASSLFLSIQVSLQYKRIGIEIVLKKFILVCFLVFINVLLEVPQMYSNFLNFFLCHCHIRKIFQSGRPAKVGRQVQPGEVLAYALANPKCSTRQISEHCGLSKSQVWKMLQESGAYPY